MISCLLDYLSYFGNYSAMLNIHEAAFSLVLGRFQNSSVPVLNSSKDSVPVSTGSTKNDVFDSGFRRFGSTVLTVLIFFLKAV